MKISLASVFSAVLVTLATTGAFASGSGNENVQLPEDVLPQLRPLLEQAMRQSPTAIERNLDLVAAEADGYMARASSMPSVGGSMSYQKQREKQINIETSGTGDRFYYNVSVNQAVWQWGTLEAARKISRIDQELAKRNYAVAYRALAAEIRSAYLGLVLQKMGVRNTEQSFRLAQENLARQQARYSANQITYGEIMTHQLRLDEASLAMRRAKADYDFSLSSFRFLTGDQQLTESEIPEAIGEMTQAPVVSQIAASSGVDAIEAVQIAEQEVEKAKLGRVGPRYALYPKLGVMAGVSRDENNRDFLVNGVIQPSKYQVDTLFAGVQLNWTIFDGFSNRGAKLAALTRLRRAEHKLAAVRGAVARNLDRDRANVGFSWDAYQVAQMRLRMAREALAHQRDEASRGQVSQEQIDLAQSNAFYFQYQAQSAAAGHLTAVVQYLSSKGVDPVVSSAVQQR